jgi:hypothetical protein
MTGNTQFINIRGTNGSGKTHLVRTRMKEVGAIPYPRRRNLFGGTSLCSRRVEYYQLGDGGVVIGTYENNCGGCDNIQEGYIRVQQLAMERMPEHPAYVLFEGVIIGSTYKPWLAFSQKVGGMLWVFLDTPLDVCVERVQQRNRGKPINLDRMREKHLVTQRDCNKAIADGEHVVVLPWKRAYSAFVKLLKP